MVGILRLEVWIKFRALGITFGNYHDVVAFPLPPVVSIVEQITKAHIAGTYDNHGVKVVASIASA